MHPHAAQRLAMEELTRLRLADKGWVAFVFGKSLKRYGCCATRLRQVRLEEPFVTVNPKWEVLRIIKHEIAHALAWEATGKLAHDSAFYACCVMLGIPDETRKNFRALRPRRLTKHTYYAIPAPRTPEETLYWGVEQGLVRQQRAAASEEEA